MLFRSSKRLLYKSIFIWKKIPSKLRQSNLRKSLFIIDESILKAIRSLLPIELILKEYLNNVPTITQEKSPTHKSHKKSKSLNYINYSKKSQNQVDVIHNNNMNNKKSTHIINKHIAINCNLNRLEPINNDRFSLLPLENKYFKYEKPPDINSNINMKKSNKSCLLSNNKCNPICSGVGNNNCNIVSPIPGPAWQVQNAETVQNRLNSGNYTRNTCKVID